MFWGLVLEPGKRYSTTVEKSFHVSKAVLDCASIKNDSEILNVILETEGSESLLCNLCKNKGILQEDLDLNFMTGDRLTFECRGQGRIHLSGYLLQDDDMSAMMEDEDDSEGEDNEIPSDWMPSPEKSKKDKRKPDNTGPNIPSKKKKLSSVDIKQEVEDEDEEEDEDDSDDEDESDMSGLDDEEVDDEEEDDEEINDEDDDESDEEAERAFQTKKQSKKEKIKTPNQKPNQQTPKKTPMTNGSTPKEQKSGKKTPVVEKGKKSPVVEKSPKQKTVLEGGVTVRDLKVGTGAPAKPGKMLTVYYVGKLKDNSKVFDKSTQGEGFKFRLGKGEVIKAWDIGLQGMKVGSKRTVICPPETAYGAKGAPPQIPPNSALVFEVELRNVS